MIGLLIVLLSVILFLIFVYYKKNSFLLMGQKIPTVSFGIGENSVNELDNELSWDAFILSEDKTVKSPNIGIISLPKEIKNNDDYEILLASGNSAIKCGVRDGDIILIEKNVAKYCKDDFALIYGKQRANLKARKLEKIATDNECVDQNYKPKCSDDKGKCWITRCETNQIEKFHCESDFLGVVIKTYSKNLGEWLTVPNLTR